MNLLITNDDGISSDGIKALEKELGKNHNTYLIAPLKERSVTSMALTIFQSMRVEKVNDNHYIADGFPADCVNIGLYAEIFPKIDFVISGVNRGVNMGYDMHYSGTVGAAKHGALHGLPSLAVSSGRIDPEDGYEREAKLVNEFLSLYASKIKPSEVWNLNFPPDIAGNGGLDQLVFTKLGRRRYTEKYDKKSIIGGVSEFQLNGSLLGHDMEAGTDFEAYNLGKIPVTPLQLDLTEFSRLQELKSHS
ncbi:5'/3'-nucleotidase SurE [Leptospira ognonensis]|uniref:5'-nucleotidase SurE n=1 Tax=Leptospira ognonensis TaxID=2484945 RepID=A0A4R9K1F9_9LEPT|nr:5'/3'-nucleotidase SurE [Leptospira ognonensis]TGL58560.1 5'/3'-nucleotidase SurE [Leptospira ognonensis]